MYQFQISDQLLKSLIKIEKKDKVFYKKILKKIDEIRHSTDLNHYKNLKHDLKNLKRVHIGHFVLMFRYDPKTNTIYFDNIEHHDKAYDTE